MIRFPILILFFCSGAAALIYELVWFHLVQLVVGASSLSMAALLATFMGGMALGSALLPRVVSQTRHPLRVVTAIELGIAAIGLAMPFALPYVQSGYLFLAGYGYTSVLMRAAVCAVVMLPPTMLMGATLPAISRWMEASQVGASRVGFLYVSNIAGGAFGTALAGFYLLRVYDTVIASFVAVALNVIAALLAWRLAKRFPDVDTTVAADAAPVEVSPLIYAVAGLSGLTALGAEVVWTRQLSLLFGASVYTFSVILAVFLVGLGIGSFTGAMIARRSTDPGRALGICQLLLILAIGFASAAIVNILPQWQPRASFLPNVKASPMLGFAFDALRCAFALLPATMLWGASFPLALGAAAGGRDSAQPVSRVNAINTIGCLIGAIGFTLIGIPMFGSQRAQQALVAIAAVSATLLLVRGQKAVRWMIPAAAIAVAVVVSVASVPPIPGRFIAYGRSVDSWSSIKELLYVAEGATASVAVTVHTGGARQFHIAGKVEASDMDIDMRLERMLGHVPALAHPHPRSVLVVGNGAGVTAGALAAHPEIQRIVICEIEPVVPKSAKMFFAKENNHVEDDPRTQVIFDDARHFMETTNEKFDIITSDPIHPWVRGAATLYSLEYLELVKKHLNPGGVVTQWIPLYETDIPSVKSELATFAKVFPDTTLWNPDLLEEGYDLVALGRTDGKPFDEAALQRRMFEDTPSVGASLAAVNLGSASALMSTYAGRGQDLAPWLADAEINRDRQLRLQYLAGLAYNSDQRYAVFKAIVDNRKYPADLFIASPETEAQLRRWYSTAAPEP